MHLRHPNDLEVAHTDCGQLPGNAHPDGDAKAPTWSRDSRRHAEELTGVSQRMMLAERRCKQTNALTGRRSRLLSGLSEEIHES
jgi:hypothetical protein